MDLKARARQLKTDIPAVFIAMKHPNTPLKAKIMAALVVVYALSPVDLVPDFIPVLGYLDDIILLPAMIAIAVKWIPESTMRECREKSEGMWKNGKPEKWYYALPFVAVWALLLFLIVKAIW